MHLWSITANDYRDYVWKALAKVKMASLGCKKLFFFSCRTWWENSCLLQKRNGFFCRAFPWRWQFREEMDRWICLFRAADASVNCNTRRSRWFGVFPVHMTARGYVSVCEGVQMWFINTSLKPSKFPAITIGWQGFSMGKRRGVFSLQQALFSPRSPGHRTPAGTRLIMHPVWRRGQSGTLRSIVWQSKLFSNMSSTKLWMRTLILWRMPNCFAVYTCCLNCVLYSYESNSTLLNQPILGTSC